jgi:hypothetical protein
LSLRRLPPRIIDTYTSAMLRHPTLALLGLALVITSAACDGDGDGTSSPTVAVSPTRNATSTPQAVADIRDVDLLSVPDVQQALADTAGEIVQDTVIYADVTRDDADEAVVPISSGGTLGDVGFLVLTPVGGGVRTLLDQFPSAGGGLAVSVEGGNVVMTQPEPGPDDPECCPSFLRVTTFAWDGAALAVESDETVPNPDALNKTPGGG